MKKIISLILAMLMTVVCFAYLGGCAKEKLPPQIDPTDDDYRVFYQIFVGSFSDSNGDGIGDLRGIINRFDYLNDGNINSGESLGIQGIWLSPIFESPSYHKYDAQDYYQIDPTFGTTEDLVELINLCHERNVKIILDLAINHTSDKNQWFIDFCKARNSNDTASPYFNYYTVKTVDQFDGNKYAKIPGSPFGEYYEANFSNDMPELDFDNQAVKTQVIDIAKHYLDLGVDGFRFDAIKYNYYNNTQKSADFWAWYMQELKKIKPDIYTVGECWSGDGEVIEYYPAINCFNFTTSQAEGAIAKSARVNMSTGKVLQKIDLYTNYVTEHVNSIKAQNPDAMYIPFIANHDLDRAAGYLSPTTFSAQMAANLYILCSGSPFIYYGEEIGLKGTRGASATDANRRLAMLWGDEDTVKDPVGADFDAKKQTNGTVKDQLENQNSLLRYYQKVIRFRIEYPEIPRGDYAQLILGKDYVGGFIITYQGKTSYLIHNTSMNEEVVDLSDYDVTEIAGAIGNNPNVKLDGKTLTISGQTSVLIR